MKKYFFLTLLTAALLIPSGVFAQSVSVCPNGMTVASNCTLSPTLSCLELTRNMTLGSQDSSTLFQVSKLQTFLHNNDYLSSNPTGYFGLTTVQAVKAFQTANGITPSSGYVGLVTREKIKEISCGGSSGLTPSITVTSPNGREIYSPTSAITVNYKSTGITGKTVTAHLYSPIISSGNNGTFVARENGSFVINLSDVSFLSAGQYKITLCAESVDSPSFPGKTLCDSSDDYFTIATPGVNTINVISPTLDKNTYMAEDIVPVKWAPTQSGVSKIDLVSFYGKLNVGLYGPKYGNNSPITSGIFNYKIPSTIPSDTYYMVLTPSDGSLPVISQTFFIGQSTVSSLTPYLTAITGLLPNGSRMTITGARLTVPMTVFIDGATYRASVNGVTTNGSSITFTFPTSIPVGTHSIRVSNPNGLSNILSFSVGGSSVAPSITVASPNGGENYNLGQATTIVWSGGKNSDGSSNGVDIKLIPQYCNNGSCVPTTEAYHTITSAASRASSYDWQVGLVQSPNYPNGYTVQPGKYYLQVCVAGTNTCDLSNNYFTITSANSQSLITLTSPNGGENYNLGQTVNITWNTSFYDRNADIGFALYDPATSNYDTFAYTKNTGSYSWTIPTSFGLSPLTQSSAYKIIISIKSGLNWEHDDTSNSTFTITSAATTQPSITVLSPKGGEVWTVGSTKTISWRTNNISSPNDKITIYIIPNDDPSKNRNLASEIPNTGSYNYIVNDPSEFSQRSPLYKAGNQFKIFVCAKLVGSNNLCSNGIGYSDSSFSIVKTSTQVPITVLSSQTPTPTPTAPTNMTVSCSASPSSVNVGQNTTFTPSFSGGNGSYSYSWWSGACAGSTASSCVTSYSNSGTQTTHVTVVSGNQSIGATCSVNVGTSVVPTPTPTPTPSCLNGAGPLMPGQSYCIIPASVPTLTPTPTPTPSCLNGAGPLMPGQSYCSNTLGPVINSTNVPATNPFSDQVVAPLVTSFTANRAAGFGYININWTAQHVGSGSCSLNYGEGTNIKTWPIGTQSGTYTFPGSAIQKNIKLRCSKTVNGVPYTHFLMLTISPFGGNLSASVLGALDQTDQSDQNNGIPLADATDVVSPTPVAAVSSCVTLANNVQYRDNDILNAGAISQLQSFLQTRGYLTSSPTGYFGDQTFQAVKSFQDANGIEATGYVGALTRAKIQELSCQ